MKFKLDENLGDRCAQTFVGAGHDTATVQGQGLSGADDTAVITRCRDEDRALVTLDLDFANPLRFKPSEYSGNAVLRPRSPTSLDELQLLCLTVIVGLSQNTLDGHLWIVEIGRIRIYEKPE